MSGRVGDDDSALPNGIERITHDKRNVRDNPRFAQARPHRCNDHLEDIFQNMGDDNITWAQWRHSVTVFYQCLKATPGNEPPRTRTPQQQKK